jgi:GxxExxY protein
MNTEQHRSEQKQGEVEYPHADITGRILGVFYDVYNELGPGFLECVYHGAMRVALPQAGLLLETEVPVPVFFRGVQVASFKVDLLVERSVILELKAAQGFDSAHVAQLLNYLRATPIEVGLLLNFGPRPQQKRLVYDNARKLIRGNPQDS